MIARDRREIQRAHVHKEDEHREQQAEVTDAIHDERLLACHGIRGVAEPEPDQQVRCEAHAFPADEQHWQVRAHHQHQHEADEQVQVGEVPCEARVVSHVANAVDVNQRAHAGDDQHHQHAELINVERPLDMERACAHPLAKRRCDGVPGAGDLRGEPDAHREREHHDADANRAHHTAARGWCGTVSSAAPGRQQREQAVHHEADERQQRDEPDDLRSGRGRKHAWGVARRRLASKESDTAQIDRAIMPEHTDDDREPDRRFSSSHGHHEQHEDLP